MMYIQWLPVPGYNNRYIVSSTGLIYETKLGYLVAQNVTDDGHLVASLEQKPVQVHRVVAKTFLGDKTSQGLVVCHNDGNGLNNDVNNLRWDTISSNTLDQVKHGVHNNASKTHCPYGAPLVPPNLKQSEIVKGRRMCLACHRTLSIKHNHRIRYGKVYTKEQLQIIHSSKLEAILK